VQIADAQRLARECRLRIPDDERPAPLLMPKQNRAAASVCASSIGQYANRPCHRKLPRPIPEAALEQFAKIATRLGKEGRRVVGCSRAPDGERKLP